MSSWQPIIGLEVHLELNTKAKMFCQCPNKHFRQKPNAHTCPVCLGLPGALPVPNIEAINKTILIALAFGAKINKNFWFDRKNYFYPDLPKGYQISQHFKPIGLGGQVPILTNGKDKNIALNNIHLEEDTGKLIHEENETLIDFNRSGVPLVEIVSQPVLSSGLEAKAYLQRLQQTLRWLRVSDCDMEKGSMRLEANISVKNEKLTIKNDKLPDYKVEIKNLNSFKFVEKAINYEIQRQIKILEKGKQPKQETRGFNLRRGMTYLQRSKEVAKDYRYFPEPDIPPFKFSQKKIGEIKGMLPKLPWQLEKDLIGLGIRKSWLSIVNKTKYISELVINTITLAKKEGITPDQLGKYIVNNPALRKQSAREIIRAIKKDRNKFSLSVKEIKKYAKQAIEEQPKAVADYKKGKAQVISFLIGQVQAKSSGKADPKITAQEIIKQIRVKK